LNIGFFTEELELDFLRENVSLRIKTHLLKNVVKAQLGEKLLKKQ
jgi:hypothetical protein